jgi:hypothetical protein
MEKGRSAPGWGAQANDRRTDEAAATMTKRITVALSIVVMSTMYALIAATLFLLVRRRDRQ